MSCTISQALGGVLEEQEQKTKETDRGAFIPGFPSSCKNEGGQEEQEKRNQSPKLFLNRHGKRKQKKNSQPQTHLT